MEERRRAFARAFERVCTRIRGVSTTRVEDSNTYTYNAGCLVLYPLRRSVRACVSVTGGFSSTYVYTYEAHMHPLARTILKQDSGGGGGVVQEETTVVALKWWWLELMRDGSGGWRWWRCLVLPAPKDRTGGGGAAEVVDREKRGW